MKIIIVLNSNHAHVSVFDFYLADDTSVRQKT